MFMLSIAFFAYIQYSWVQQVFEYDAESTYMTVLSMTALIILGILWVICLVGKARIKHFSVIQWTVNIMLPIFFGTILVILYREAFDDAGWLIKTFFISISVYYVCSGLVALIARNIGHKNRLGAILRIYQKGVISLLKGFLTIIIPYGAYILLEDIYSSHMDLTEWMILILITFAVVIGSYLTYRACTAYISDEIAPLSTKDRKNIKIGQIIWAIIFFGLILYPRAEAWLIENRLDTLPYDCEYGIRNNFTPGRC